MADLEAMAASVVLAIQTALKPVTARLETLSASVLGLEAHSAELQTLGARLHGLETNAVTTVQGPVGETGPPGKDGTSVTVDDLRGLVEAAVATATKDWPIPKDGARGADGASVTVEDVRPVVAAEVAAAVAALPDMETLVAHVVAAVPPPPPGRDGKDADPLDLEAVVTRVVAAIPPPAAGPPGTSVTLEEIRPLVEATVAIAVDAIPRPRDGKDGKDGIGLAAALLDRDGHLVVTMSDGAIQQLGAVVGRDVDMLEVKRTIAAELAAWPKPHDGKDGLGFDDLDFDFDEHGRLLLRFRRGEIVKAVRVPGLVDRGVYQPDDMYLKGDVVTYAGAIWIAQTDAPTKPGDQTRSWRLSVKPGRDGRDARGPAPTPPLPIVRTK